MVLPEVMAKTPLSSYGQKICPMLCAKNWREEAILSGIENILQRRFGTNAAESDTAGDTTRAGKRLSEAWFPS